MAERYVNVDRETPMLLPPDLRDWVAENDLARLILEAVELCETGGARVNVRGTGSAQYPPSMMLALLIYCYASGVFSSRRIERASYESVAVRYLCANHHPDHDTIAKFRRENEALFRSCFSQVLMLAREAGVLRVGTVSLDGTRLAGAGSGRAVRTLEQLERELESLGGELLGKAEAADGEDLDGGGMQLPEELSDGAKRKAKLRAAKAALEARRGAAAAAGVRDRPGSARRSASASVSEPESRRLRGGSGPPVQGYNAQAAVDAGQSGLIVGAHLSDAPNDLNQLAAGLEAVPAPLARELFAVVVDKGYDHTAQIARVERERGLLVLCPPQRRPTGRENNPRRRGLPQWKWEQRRQMEQRLACPLLRALHRRRAPSVEGAFARIKTHLGFRRFQVWGKKAATAENAPRVTPGLAS